MLSYVDSVFLFTDNLPRLLAFYRDTLELPVLYETDRYSLVGQGSGSMIGIQAHTQIHGQAREPQRMMIDFFCEDVFATVTRLRQRGVRFIEEPLDVGGATTATFVDPDGNYLRLINYTVG